MMHITTLKILSNLNKIKKLYNIVKNNNFIFHNLEKVLVRHTDVFHYKKAVTIINNS